MTAPHLAQTRDTAQAPPTVDIAGSRWPVYKLEALAAALLTFVVVALVLGSAQAGVLLGASLATVLWTIGWYRTAR